MDFLARLGKRLGFILLFAVLVRGVGFVANTVSPPDEAQAASALPSGLTLDAPLMDPEMHAHYETLLQNGLIASDRKGEATGRFRSENGEVFLSESDIALLNSVYRSSSSADPSLAEGDAMMEEVMLEEASAEDLGWGAGG